MQITNSTGVDLYVATLQAVVNDGDTIEVDDEIAEQLELQGWTVKTTKTKTKAAEADSEEN